MMDPAMMAQMIQQQQQQIIQQQNMIAGNSMMGSMYDQNVSAIFHNMYESQSRIQMVKWRKLCEIIFRKRTTRIRMKTTTREAVARIQGTQHRNENIRKNQRKRLGLKTHFSVLQMVESLIKYSSSERSSSRGSSLERDLKKIKIRDDYVTIPVKVSFQKRFI